MFCFILPRLLAIGSWLWVFLFWGASCRLPVHVQRSSGLLLWVVAPSFCTSGQIWPWSVFSTFLSRWAEVPFIFEIKGLGWDVIACSWLLLYLCLCADVATIFIWLRLRGDSSSILFVSFRKRVFQATHLRLWGISPRFSSTCLVTFQRAVTRHCHGDLDAVAVVERLVLSNRSAEDHAGWKPGFSSGKLPCVVCSEREQQWRQAHMDVLPGFGNLRPCRWHCWIPHVCVRGWLVSDSSSSPWLRHVIQCSYGFCWWEHALDQRITAGNRMGFGCGPVLVSDGNRQRACNYLGSLGRESSN